MTVRSTVERWKLIKPSEILPVRYNLGALWMDDKVLLVYTQDFWRYNNKGWRVEQCNSEKIDVQGCPSILRLMINEVMFRDSSVV